MRIEINRLLSPVTVLGAGRRAALWVQGCGLQCPGCASTDTWIVGEGHEKEVSDVAGTIIDLVNNQDLDGLTLTGGEPLDQAAALAELVRNVRDALATQAQRRFFDVLVFTGYGTRAAQTRAGRLWELVDAAVCGRYLRDAPCEAPLIASRNQELVALSDLGRRLYPLAPGRPHMQVLADGTDLHMVGLPRPGDLDVIRDRLAAAGIMMAGQSWQS